jgi:sporulation protein YlmC with PRC-barrel domain
VELARYLGIPFAAWLAGATLSAAAQPAFQGMEMRVSEILGREVRGARGEALAIRDLLVDPATRRVEYLVLGPASGDAQELPLYPVDALRSAEGGVLLVVLAEGGSSSGASAPRAHLSVGRLGRIEDLVLRLTDGRVGVDAPP